jgi:hypothetical protein
MAGGQAGAEIRGAGTGADLLPFLFWFAVVATIDFPFFLIVIVRSPELSE